MKRISLSILICYTFTLSLKAQTTGDYSNSITVKGFNILQFPALLNQIPKNYVNSAFSGAMIRFNQNQISYRLSGSYISKSLQFPKDCENCDIASGNVKDYTFKLGFEKSFNYAVIQPYFAFDVGYRYNQFQGMMKTFNNQKLITMANYTGSIKDGFTITPAIGLRINFLEQFSFFIESSPEFFYAYTREEVTPQNMMAVKTVTKYSRGEFLLNPLAVGIQLHLNNKNY